MVSNPFLMLKSPYCRTSTFQGAFFNQIVETWNNVGKIASPEKFARLAIFKNFLHVTYTALVNSTFNVAMACTWSLSRQETAFWGFFFGGGESITSLILV